MGGKHRNRKGPGLGDIALYGALALFAAVVLMLIVSVFR
jgi:hypothetical protein